MLLPVMFSNLDVQTLYTHISNACGVTDSEIVLIHIGTTILNK